MLSFLRGDHSDRLLSLLTGDGVGYDVISHFPTGKTNTKTGHIKILNFQL